MPVAGPAMRMLTVVALALTLLNGPAHGASFADNELDEVDTNKTPFALPKDVTCESDIAYGSHARHTLDIYRSSAARNAPIILLVHGGGWAHGDKAMRAVVENKVRRWTGKGLVLIAINYRLLPEAPPLAQAEDVALALAFVQRNAASWGGDGNRVMLMGHSAGAHLVSLISAQPDLAKKAGAQRWLGTVALDSAAFDVEAIMKARHFRLYDKAFGEDAAVWRAASPLHVLVGTAPSMLAVCSTRREIACEQAKVFAERAQTMAVRVQVLPQDLRHRQINQELGLDSDYTKAVEAFMATLDTGVAARLAQAPRTVQ